MALYLSRPRFLQEHCIQQRELKRLVQSIKEAKDEKECITALECFKSHLQPKSVVTSGKHFNIQILADALNLQQENFINFGGFWASQRSDGEEKMASLLVKLFDEKSSVIQKRIKHCEYKENSAVSRKKHFSSLA